MSKKKIGRCRLCLQDGRELQDSHFLPKAIYRAIREKNVSNPNPVLITPSSAKQTSYQQTAPLLCRDCEQRFSKMGESWTLAHSLRDDGTFALSEILDSYSPVFDAAGTRIYLTAGIPEIDRDALIYFASSMFWRASIYPWKNDNTYPVKLGQHYGEQFRLFLLGQRPFPSEASLLVAVREDSKLSKLTYNPAGGRTRNAAGEHLGYSYRFPMPGFVFVLTVGKNRLEENKQFCIVRGDGNPIIVTSKIEILIEEEAISMAKRVQANIAERAGRKKPS